jgi:hypothetical protein
VWIDQLYINQADDTEKSVQVDLMSEIYSKARSVIVWLGPEMYFRPDFEQSIKHNFIRFADTVGRDFGYLDFLGLCAAKLDTLIKGTAAEAQGPPR